MRISPSRRNTALIKSGIALLSHYKLKVRSIPGHHIKLIEKLTEILGDQAISDLGNAMRQKRNVDLYAGGTDITSKECAEYLDFVEGVFFKVSEKIGLPNKHSLPNPIFSPLTSSLSVSLW